MQDTDKIRRSKFKVTVAMLNLKSRSNYDAAHLTLSTNAPILCQLPSNIYPNIYSVQLLIYSGKDFKKKQPNVLNTSQPNFLLCITS